MLLQLCFCRSVRVRDMPYLLVLVTAAVELVSDKLA